MSAPRIELYLAGDLTPEVMDSLRTIMATTSACGNDAWRESGKMHFHLYMKDGFDVEAIEIGIRT